MHATFQEWALAHHLAQQENPLVSAVQTYWYDPSYDEVLALLWVHDAVDDVQREVVTYFLMDAGCQKQAGSNGKWRSGLKQSLVFWDLVGIQMPKTIAQNIWQIVESERSLKGTAKIIETNQKFFMAKLMVDKDSYVRQNLAKNPNLSVEAMQQLVGDEDNDIRQNLAKNPNLSVEAMQQLAMDEDNDIRQNLAKNPNLSVETMQQLAMDKDICIRENLAGNPHLSAKVMQQLAIDKDSYVRGNLAKNPNLSVKLMSCNYSDLQE